MLSYPVALLRIMEGNVGNFIWNCTWTGLTYNFAWIIMHFFNTRGKRAGNVREICIKPGYRLLHRCHLVANFFRVTECRHLLVVAVLSSIHWRRSNIMVKIYHIGYIKLFYTKIELMNVYWYESNRSLCLKYLKMVDKIAEKYF